MAEHLTYTVNAGDLGELVIAWEVRGLQWMHPDRSVGEVQGWWEGTPKLLGGDLGSLPLDAKQVETLWTGMVNAGPTPEETKQRAVRLLARHAREAMRGLPPPAERRDAA